MVPGLGETPATLGDRYTLVDVIGAGGMAVVWRAFDTTLRRPVAVKVLSGPIAHDPTFRKRFHREARHVASLSHPNIVQVFDFGIDGDRSYLVMEHVGGISLRDLLSARSTLPVPVTAAIAADTLAALDHAHRRGIVHRDVKPGNLLLERHGSVKVADFGISKSFGETTDLTVGGGFVGTAAYASPEQLGGQPVTAVSDLYSLGCVLFQCLAGKPPYEADNAEHLVLQHRFADPPSLSGYRHDLPDALVDALGRVLAKDPEDRFSGAAEMREVFVPYAAEDELHTVLQLWQPDDSDGTEIHDDRPIGVATRPAPAAPDVRNDLGRPWWRRRVVTFGGLAAVAACGVIAGLLATSGGTGGSLISGAFLQPSQSITSPNGRYTLVMQGDGNLVEYVGKPGNDPVWESGTSGNFNAYVVMQADGNLVVYPQGKAAAGPGQPPTDLWNSGTWGHRRATASLLDTGALVVQASGNGAVLWSNGLGGSGGAGSPG